MKKAILLSLIVLKSFSQSVLIEPGKQGFSNTNTPKGTIELNGNGLLIQKKYKLTTVNPTESISLMNCGTSASSTQLAGIIKDPNGDGPYIAGIVHNCYHSIDLSGNPEVIGIRFIIEELDFGTGDGIYAYPLIYGLPTGPFQGDTVEVFRNSLDLNFYSNSDMSVGNGFRIRWQALLADDSANPLQNIKNGLAKFAVDINNNIFRFGSSQLQDNYNKNTIAIGKHAWVDGDGGLAIGSGSRATSFEGAIAIGSGATSLGNNAIALGNQSLAIGSNSLAILNGYTDAQNSVVLGNSDIYSANGAILIGEKNQAFPGATKSIALGENILLEHENNFALGKNLKSLNANSILLGVFNGNLATSLPTSNAKIFELGNGTSTTETHNAITVLANGKVGLGVYSPTEILDVAGNLKLSGNNAVSGNLTVNGTFRLGLGSSILNEILKLTKTIDLPSITVGGTNTQNISFSGADLGSTVYVSPSASLNDGIVIASARVSASNTVEIKFSNITAAAINPASMDFYITIVR